MTPIPVVVILAGPDRTRSEAMACYPISHDEMDSCNETNQIVGVSGAHKAPMTYLKFAFRTGDTELVCLDATDVRRLVAVLKSLIPKFEAIEGLPIVVDLETVTNFASSS